MLAQSKELRKSFLNYSPFTTLLVLSSMIIIIFNLINNLPVKNNTSDILNNKAADIINTSGSIKLVYDTLMISGEDADSIVFIPGINSTPSNPNILDPQYNLSLSENWIYNSTGFFGNDVGTSLNDPVILLTGIKYEVCKKINNNLYGMPIIPNASIESSNLIKEGTNKAFPTSSTTLNFSDIKAVSGWTSGCISTNAGSDDNIYFRILKQN